MGSLGPFEVDPCRRHFLSLVPAQYRTTDGFLIVPKRTFHRLLVEEYNSQTEQTIGWHCFVPRGDVFQGWELVEFVERYQIPLRTAWQQCLAPLNRRSAWNSVNAFVESSKCRILEFNLKCLIWICCDVLILEISTEKWIEIMDNFFLYYVTMHGINCIESCLVFFLSGDICPVLFLIMPFAWPFSHLTRSLLWKG